MATVARLAGPGGVRAVVAESVLVKQQLLILNRPSKGAPSLRLALIGRSPACARCSCARSGWSVCAANAKIRVTYRDLAKLDEHGIVVQNVIHEEGDQHLDP
jgi:hypothetical protein